MQIFCKETQAHLDQNPHLMDKGKTSNDNLITPELWMKNCRSRSVTPDQRSNDSRGSESPMSNQTVINQMPTIKVAPVSKLLPIEYESAKNSHRQQREEPTTTPDPNNSTHFRTMRTRRANRLSSSSNSVNASDNISEGSNSNNNDSINENRNMHTSIHRANMISQRNKFKNSLQPSLMPCLQSIISPKSIKSAPIDEPFGQRYQLMSLHTPNTFRKNENRSLQNARRQSIQFIAPLIPNHSFADTSPPEAMTKMPSNQVPFAMLSPLHRQQSEPMPSMSSGRKHIFQPDHQMFLLQQQQQKVLALNELVSNIFGTTAPPSTLLIPYPIVLPLPLPIPIPLPYEAFLRAAKLNPKNNSQPNDRSSSTIEDDCNASNVGQHKLSDQPLDFTKDEIAKRHSINSDDESDDYRTSHSVLEADHRSKVHHKFDQVKSDSLKLKAKQQPNKRTFTKESVCENNRPLRKRKRVIDCDYLRLRDTNSNESGNPRKSN